MEQLRSEAAQRGHCTAIKMWLAIDFFLLWLPACILSTGKFRRRLINHLMNHFDLRGENLASTSITSSVAGYQQRLLWRQRHGQSAARLQLIRPPLAAARCQGVKVRRWWLKHGPGRLRGSRVFETFLTTSHEFYARVNQSSTPQRNQRRRTLISVSGDQCKRAEDDGWTLWSRVWKNGREALPYSELQAFVHRWGQMSHARGFNRTDFLHYWQQQNGGKCELHFNKPLQHSVSSALLSVRH